MQTNRSPWTAELETARQLADETSALLLRHLEAGVPAEEKGILDVVTAADRASERLLRERLAAAFPADRFLGEEDGESGPADTDARLWACDPLDGTVNYVHHHPFFCVSIALLEAGRPVVGVIAAPRLGRTWWAVRGSGAFCNDRPIRVSRTDDPARALVATGFPGASHRRPERFLAAVAEVLRRTHGIRRCGAAALDLAMTADGTYDAYYEMALHTWDVAAGILLVEEAGGRVTDYDGGPPDLAGRTVAASNGPLHPFLLELLRATERVDP